MASQEATRAVYCSRKPVGDGLVYWEGPSIAVVGGVGRIWFATGTIADIALSVPVAFHLDDILVCPKSLLVHFAQSSVAKGLWGKKGSTAHELLDLAGLVSSQLKF